MAEIKGVDTSDKYLAGDAVHEVSSGFGITPSVEDASFQARLSEQINHRKLNSRQVQLTSIAGAIGAMLFVSIGGGLASGPICLLIAYFFWCSVVYGIAQCQLEIVTLFPLDGSFLRLAGRMVDPALEVAVSWNMFFAMTSYVIFEATIINTLVGYWGYDLSPAVLITISLVIYFALNIWRADLFGEVEFWIALGKVLLALGMIVYTFIVMVGGNPLHDKFGFRYWKEPAPWVGDDSSSRMKSFVNAIIIATFTMGGPEYISMIAGEAKQPRKTIARAFRTIMLRLIIFNIGGALCIGILVPSNDPTLRNGSDTYAGGSPYIISMKRLGVKVLPSIVTAALITTIVSAGNAYTFGASRSLHALALDGKAPKILKKTNRHGVPYVGVICVGLLSTLAYLALGSTSAKVLSWITSFCTAATLFNWVVMSITYIRFQRAIKVQGLKREEYLLHRSRFQPWISYWSFFWSFLFLFVQGYGVFLKGKWDTATFIFNYGIIGLAGGLGLAHKIIQRTPFRRAKDIDLHTDLDLFQALDEHYETEKEVSPSSRMGRIAEKVF